MIKRVLFSVTFLALIFNCVSASAVDLSERDKNLHVGLSYQLTATSNHALRELGVSKTTSSLISAGTVFLIGVLKEFAIDQNPDRNDIRADAIGTALGAVIPFRIEF